MPKLRIPILGTNINLYSHDRTKLAIGYVRVVIGKRGPYVEFLKSHIEWNQFIVPENQFYRFDSKVTYYNEFRSIDNSFVMLYEQKRLVKYADYKIGMYYISPKDLETENGINCYE